MLVRGLQPSDNEIDSDLTPERMEMESSNVVASFQGRFRFLSNFWPAAVLYKGRWFPSVEHAYQAAKFPEELHPQFQVGSPGQAKRLSRTLTPAVGWEDSRLAVMKELLVQKFTKTSEAGIRLMGTDGLHLIEGDTWGDVFWGVSGGAGENDLGRILTEVRDSLLAEVP